VAGERRPDYDCGIGCAGTGGKDVGMIPLRIASTLALGCIALFADSVAKAEPRAVLELFTSQGCSSCPAADRLLGELGKDSSLLTLTLAVDYWDYLGWKDTLATRGHTARQRAYSKARGDREVYTPQMVVNGTAQVLGSDKAAIERAIAQSRAQSDTLALGVTATVAGDKLTVDVPAKNGQGAGEIWLCPITKAVPVKIGRGENRGHTVTYTNVVRRWTKLGEWTGKAQTFNVPLKDLQTGEIDSVAVVVQSGVASAPKLMLGAAHVAVR
jgi:hypothetical protein